MSKKRKNIIKIIVFLVIVLFAAKIVVNGINIIKLSAERDEAQKLNEQLTQEKEDLKNELENVKSKEYIERIARRDLKLIKQNELLFVLPEFISEDEDELIPELSEEDSSEAADQTDNAESAENDSTDSDDESTDSEFDESDGSDETDGNSDEEAQQ